MIDQNKWVKQESTTNPILKAIGNVSGVIFHTFLRIYLKWGTFYAQVEEVKPVKKTVKKVVKKAPAKKVAKKTTKKAATKKK